MEGAPPKIRGLPRPEDDTADRDDDSPPTIPIGTKQIAAIFGSTTRWVQKRLHKSNPPPIHRDPETGTLIAVHLDIVKWVRKLPAAHPNDLDEAN